MALIGCSLEQKVTQRQTVEAASPALALTAPVGLENFRQARATREAITGVTVDEATFKTIVSRLSQDGDSQSLGAPMVMAYAQLSAALCSGLVTNEAASAATNRRAFSAVDFSTRDISADTRSTVSRDLFRLVLQRDPVADETAALSKAMADTIAATPVAESPTRNAALVACTAVFTSPDAIAH